MRSALGLRIALDRFCSRRVLPAARAISGAAARHCWRLGLLALLTGSAPAQATLSCQTGAGHPFGGAFDECMPRSGKFDASAVATEGTATVSARTGAMAGVVTVTPSTIADGRFYSELIADFQISGPASGSVPVQFIFSSSGRIQADCVNCEADVSYAHQIDSVSFSGFRMRTSGVRTLSSSKWEVTSSKSDTSGRGLNPSSSESEAGDFASGVLAFDAASSIGHTFRLTSSLSGNAHLTGINPTNAFVTVDSGHTALFNVLFPAGYSLVSAPAGIPLLTEPILLAVPEPSSYLLIAVGLGLVGFAARRRVRA